MTDYKASLKTHSNYYTQFNVNAKVYLVTSGVTWHFGRFRLSVFQIPTQTVPKLGVNFATFLYKMDREGNMMRRRPNSRHLVLPIREADSPTI